MTDEVTANALAGEALNHFDVVIAGGGLSGALMALSLAALKQANGQPLKIALVEANPVIKDVSLSFDDRVLALSHGTSAYLQGLGAWQHLQQDAEAIKTIHISDRGHYGKARVYAEDHQVPALGYVVEMALIGKALLKSLAGFSNIHWYRPDTIENIHWQKDKVILTLTSGEGVSANLLLACDGGMSVCRDFANIKVRQHSYQQSALIANVSTAKPHAGIAYERFTETGPIAMLPLSGDRCSLVWTLTPQQAEEVQGLDDRRFKRALEEAFGSYLGQITQAGERFVYPLNLIQAEQQVYHRMALVGNASHTIHPIAGQGFNLGVRDVEQLAALIKEALAHNQDIGNFALLGRYQQQRASDQKEVITLTDSLVTLFSNRLPPLVAGRNIGLKVMNYLSPLKNAFVQKTMGY
ncbi:2-octaprenyl-6-methoxyphenyl hydroxylase [Thalassomonas viridans]|uniref:2-octaprenyl-6-methoxyphenyl hydroxylase n=1 Tax=Thalassomonas viridans TaxID=137584 RepID=A0AAE9Z4U0_9GAMM|nr:2-octaprenyl-6-methoxyphenyl hydroxylase [Thalassomonas viridans]WDE06633.1 2-octaprenyl-6-methoxyphenyl hydroxylase [Thalassomonas viridans]